VLGYIAAWRSYSRRIPDGKIVKVSNRAFRRDRQLAAVKGMEPQRVFAGLFRLGEEFRYVGDFRHFLTVQSKR
jgi:hypothetical protein